MTRRRLFKWSHLIPAVFLVRSQIDFILFLLYQVFHNDLSLGSPYEKLSSKQLNYHLPFEFGANKKFPGSRCSSEIYLFGYHRSNNGNSGFQ